MQAVALWRTRDHCGKSPGEVLRTVCKRMKVRELWKIFELRQPRKKSTGRAKKIYESK